MVKQSMNAFLQQAGTLLYRYLRKRGLAHEDAEDIVQEPINFMISREKKHVIQQQN